MINAILAMSQNRVIGKENQLPWHIPEDLKFFREKTKHHPVIMGRKTWESLKGKPLPLRTNIVVSRHLKQSSEIEVCSTIKEALERARKSQGHDEIFLIGGAELIKESLPHIERFYLTLIHQNFDGDSFLPPFENEFHIVHQERHVDGAIPFTFITYVRR